ncbi:site-2 protease family protein [Streptomyces sp. NPDC029554]|uniref:site-2 protease family protein n=1 Tax=Streptomyces sp. NPDC029554 TaxID=3155126 RepID=UPI003406C81A
MEESGGRGQPRSGNDESAEHHAGPPARPAGPASPDERPVEDRPFTPTGPDTAPPKPGPATAEKRTSETPTEEQLAEEKPTGEMPTTEEPAGEKPTAVGPAGEKPTAVGPAGEKPTAVGPAGEKPTGPSPAPGPVAADAPAAGPAPANEPAGDGSGPGPAAAPSPTPRPATSSTLEAGTAEQRDVTGAPRTDAPAGPTGPAADAHPDRAYAGDPHPGPAPDGSTTDDRHAPPADGRPAADPGHPAPGADGRPAADSGHSTPGDGRRAADSGHSTPGDGRRAADSGDSTPGDGRPAADPRHPAPGADEPGADRGHPGSAPSDHRPDRRAPAPGAPDHRPGAPAGPPSAPGHRPLAHSADGKGPAPQRPEPRGGLLMGRPFGVPVYVAPSWFLVAALITWVFGGQLERVLPELGAARYLVSLFFAVAFYASVLVHELAHTVAALRFKLPVRRIQLQFFGGVSEIEKEAETPGREFVLAFVGPLLSLVLAGVFYAGLQAVDPGTVPGVLLAGLMISNLIVAAFNLLPGLPLDGGRMLRAVVWKLTGKPMSGTIAAAWVGRALAVSVLIGLPLLTQSGALGSDAVDNVGMDTVLDALLAAILAAIIWTGAGNSLRMARLREHLPELQARTLTRRAVPVEGDTPLSEALRRANAAGARALVVVDADGRPLSLVREAAIVGVPEHRRPWVAVSGLAQDLTDGMRVSAELSGEELLDALRATPATEYLVVEETGEIYGVLSAADVERAFVKAMARPS